MDMINFPTTNQYSRTDVKKVQKRLLEMAEIATKILDCNNIPYMISYGTLLGAVRHKGFIPWDDDFDLFLFDDNYDQALRCLRKELPTDIIVHDRETDPIYWPAWSRLRDIHSRTHATQFPDDNAYRYTGINLDLYRLRQVPRALVDIQIKQMGIEFLVRKHSVGMLSDSEYQEKFDLWTREYTALVAQKPEQVDLADRVYSFLADMPLVEVGDVFPLQKYQFEGIEFWGPNNADALLSTSYGDYMQIPPYEKRRPHYDHVEFKE